jgi:hypothetical protein
MFISDHILKSLADDFARERRATANCPRRTMRAWASLRDTLTRERTGRASSTAPAQAPKTSHS